jgi:hypothetical protein
VYYFEKRAPILGAAFLRGCAIAVSDITYDVECDGLQNMRYL